MSDVREPLLPADSRSPSSLVHLGGMIGVGASAIGLAVFVGGCFGYARAFQLCYLPLLMATVGMAMTIVGGVRRHGGVEHTGILAGIWVNLFGLVGGLIELALWKDWSIFHRVAGQ